MRPKRIFSSLAPALAIAALIGFAAPVATHAQTAAPATTAPLGSLTTPETDAACKNQPNRTQAAAIQRAPLLL